MLGYPMKMIPMLFLLLLLKPQALLWLSSTYNNVTIFFSYPRIVMSMLSTHPLLKPQVPLWLNSIPLK